MSSAPAATVQPVAVPVGITPQVQAIYDLATLNNNHNELAIEAYVNDDTNVDPS
jgi:hypothetical protein